MSFDEIGRELGLTRGGAWMLYKSAMQKLSTKGRRVQCEAMLRLARLKSNPVI